MSKKVYINHNIGGITGYYSSPLNSGMELGVTKTHTYLGQYDIDFNNVFDQERLHPTTIDNVTNTQSITFSTANKYTVANVLVTLNNSNVDYYNNSSTFKLGYYKKISYGITFKATYANGATLTQVVYIPLSTIGNRTSYTGDVPLPIFASYNKQSSDTKYYHITKIELVTNAVTNLKPLDSSITTSIAAQAIVDLQYLKPVSISYTKYTPTSSAIVTTLYPPTNAAGKIYLKHSKFTYPAQMCVKQNFPTSHDYPYHTGSSAYNKSWDYTRTIQVAEISTEGIYRSKSPDWMISIDDSGKDESLDSSTVYKVYGGANTFSSEDTLVDFGQLEKAAFSDFVIVQLLFKDSAANTLATKRANVTTLILEGIECPANTYKIEVQISVLHLVNLTLIEFTNNPAMASTEAAFQRGYPADAIVNLDLQFGYQSYVDTTTAHYLLNKGIYIGKNKARRVFINNTEINSIVVDSLATSTLQTQVSALTKSSPVNINGQTYYPATGAFITDSEVIQAFISGTQTGHYEVDYSNRVINFTLYGTSPYQTLTATLTYVI